MKLNHLLFQTTLQFLFLPLFKLFILSFERILTKSLNLFVLKEGEIYLGNKLMFSSGEISNFSIYTLDYQKLLTTMIFLRKGLKVNN